MSKLDKQQNTDNESAKSESLAKPDGKQPQTDLNSTMTTSGTAKEEQQTKCLSFLKRNAFVIALMMNAMIEALLHTTRSQYRFRFFQSQYEGELLGRSNVTRACGEAMEPEVQVGLHFFT